MKKTTAILQAVLVNYFYATNAGFFYFLIVILFAAPTAPLYFHLSLITGIVQSQVFLALVMLVWLLYNVKCINYVLKQLNQPRQAFLFCLNSLSLGRTYILMVYVQVLVYLPVLLYAVAMVWVAVKKREYWCVTEVLIFNAALIMLTALLFVFTLQKRQLFKKQLVSPSINLHIKKPFFSLPLYFLLHGRKQMLFVTKIFSLALLFGFLKLYEPDRYDIRPLELCLLLTAASHSAIVYQVRLFEDEFLSFSRNLPLHIIRRFLQVMALYTCLLLPEIILVLKGLQVHFALYDYPQLVLQLVAFPCIFHVVLLLETMNMEQYLRVVFWIMAASFFILLYNPGVFLFVAILLLALALFNSYFYVYEKKYNKPGE